MKPLAVLLLLCLSALPAFAQETTPTLLGTIPIEASAPGEILFNPTDRKLYLTNGTTNLLVLDPEKRAVEKTIPLPFEGGQMAFNEKANLVYVLGNSTGKFVALDCAKGTVTNPVNVTTNTVNDIAYNPTHDRVYISANDKVRTFDGTTLDPDETISVGPERNPIAGMLAVDPRENKIYCVLGGQDRISVIDGDLDVERTEILCKRVPRAIACLPSLKRLYVSSEDGYITVYDTSTNTIKAEIKVISAVGGFTGPGRFAGDDRAKKLFFDGNGIAAFDLNTNTQLSSVSAGDPTYGLAFDPKENRVFDVGSVADKSRQVFCLSYGKSNEPFQIKGRLFTWIPDPKKPSKLIQQGVARVPIRIASYKSQPRYRTIFSDKDGNYTLRVSAGNYSVTPFLGGDTGLSDNFDPIEAPCEVKGKDVTADFVTYSISGHLTQNDGSALANTKIALTRPGRDDVIATTDVNGSYTFANLGPATYTLIPYAPQGQDFIVRQAVCTVPATPSPNAQADFRLAP